eukprot:symbB.v1.2.005560.t1/scaffold296.1/size257539/2
MPLVQPHQVKERKAPEPELQPLKPMEPTARLQNGYGDGSQSKTVSIQGIYQDPKRVSSKKQDTLLREVKTTRVHNSAAVDDDDDDEVPPLECRQ